MAIITVTKKSICGMNLYNQFQRWAAPYSPLAPLEQELIRQEMQSASLLAAPGDIHAIVEALNASESEDFTYTVLNFAWLFMKEQGGDAVIAVLFERFRKGGSHHLLSVMGYGKNAGYAASLLIQVDFRVLEREARFSLLDGLHQLRWPASKAYLETIRKQAGRDDVELIREIDVCLQAIDD